jgi:hypothetical protein
MLNMKAENGFASIKGLPVQKAASFEPTEIKGNKSNAKLPHDEASMSLMSASAGKIQIYNLNDFKALLQKAKDDVATLQNDIAAINSFEFKADIKSCD